MKIVIPNFFKLLISFSKCLSNQQLRLSAELSRLRVGDTLLGKLDKCINWGLKEIPYVSGAGRDEMSGFQ